MGAFGWLAFDTAGYSRKQNRQGIGVAWGGKLTARPLGASSGITSPVTLSVTSTVWTVGSFTAIADLESDATMGPTPVVSDGNQTGVVTAASGSFDRYDLLYLTLDDATALEPVIEYTAGTVATTLPATPSEAMAFAQITVPRSGTGSPTVTLIAPRAYAVGGIATAASSGFYPANPYVGQCVDDATLGQLRWDGSEWSNTGGDSGWQNLTLNGGISLNSLAPAVRLLGGVVYFRGDAKGTSNFNATTNYTIVAASGVPAAMRPANNHLMPIVSSGAANGLFAFNTDGSITLLTGSAAMPNAQFGGCAYPVG